MIMKDIDLTENGTTLCIKDIREHTDIIAGLENCDIQKCS